MNVTSFFQNKVRVRVLFAGLAVMMIGASAGAREFSWNGVTLDLQEVTGTVPVYFSAMRLNRAVNEWNVEVTLSNAAAQAASGPLVLLVDSYTNTSGPLRPDGASAGQYFYDLSGQLANGALAPGGKSAPRTLGLGFLAGVGPKLVTRVYAAPTAAVTPAIGFARSLNGVGQPLPGVDIQEQGPAGNTPRATDDAFGVVTLGQGAGEHVWQFSREGYLPVWRRAALQTDRVSVIPYPWLAARNAQSVTLSPLTGGAVSNQTVRVRFGPGSVTQTATARLTGLNGQTLPAFLPQGWSPLQAFWLECSPEPTQPAEASLVPWGFIGSAELAALVKFDPSSATWLVRQTVNGNGTNALAVSLPGSGAYALVVPDSIPSAPPAAVVGAALQPSAGPTPDSANLQASGTVIPAASPASLVPELVTATADVVISNVAGALPSGTLLRGEVSQRYRLQDGASRVPPVYDQFVVGYQRPGEAVTGTLHATFPMRPVLLFGPERLEEALVHVDLFAPGAFSGGILDTNGGLIASERIRLLAGAGTLRERQAIQLRNLNPTNFTNLAGTNFPVLAAFETAVAGLAPGQALSIQISGLPANATFVLARVVQQEGLFGLEPRARMRSDASGNLMSDEPAAGDRLPGLTGAGQFVLLQVAPQQGLVEGIAKNSNGQPAGGLPVRVAGQPWLTFSAVDGAFKLLAPAGDGTVVVTELASGDTGTQAITVPTDLSLVNVSVAAVLAGLQVASITPADQATNVTQVAAVTIQFNRPVNPGTLVGGAIQLFGTSNQLVDASFTLNLANTTVTLLPNEPLAAATQFTVALATNIADTLGRPLSPPTRFTFTTAALSARDPAAQLIIYEPGAMVVPSNIVAQIPGFVPGTNKNIIVIQGTPGSADPGVPVILVNEVSGETTTVLSNPDGSFVSYIAGMEQDFISATFISLNGSRVYVPVSRQLFDDGSVGLYSQGGTLQVQGDLGPVQLTVPPNAIPTRTKFKLASVNAPQLESQLGGTLPADGVVAGGALNVRIEGPEPTLPLQVRFPVDLLKLGYPTNEAPTNVAAVLAIAHTNQDVVAYQVMDQMLFTPQPAAQLRQRRGPKNDNEQVFSGILDTGAGLVLQLHPAGAMAQNLFNCCMVPILFGPRPVVIKGKAGAIPMELAIVLEQTGVFAQMLSLQTGNQTVDMTYEIAQNLNIPGLPQNPLGGAAAVVSIGVQAMQLALVKIAQPLPGAFVTCQLSSKPISGQPGRINPGMVYATSGADGYFLLVAPAAGFNYLVRCTHPLFQEVQEQSANPLNVNPFYGQGELSLSGVVWKNFLFTRPLLSQVRPSVSVAFSPVEPSAGEKCEVQVNAFMPPPLKPPSVHVALVEHGITNLITGMQDTNVFATLTNQVATTNGNNVRWTGTLFVDKPVTATLKIFVPGPTPDQNFGPAYLTNQFTGPKPSVPTTIPPPDTNDVHGPLVVQTVPLENGFVGEDSTITISFNKPIDAFVTSNLTGLVLTPPPPVAAPVVKLSTDQQTLALQYAGLEAGQTYQLTLSGQSIRDLASPPHVLDQKPATDFEDTFTLTFRKPAANEAALSGLANGRGSAIIRNRLYVLDQASQGNYLLTYDITTPRSPQFLSRTHLFGAPRDLVVLPQFSYVRNAHAPVETNDLIVVVGGDLDAVINDVQGTTVAMRGQYLWVLKDDWNQQATAVGGPPHSLQVLASPILSYRVGSVVPKVRWAPPYLVFQEFGTDIQRLGLVDLQTLLIGYGSTRVQQDVFPAGGKDGLDRNGDGDYVDEGETLPLPEHSPAEFYGLYASFVLQHTSQKILDFSVTPGLGTLGITLKEGQQLDDYNRPIGRLGPSYRTLVHNGVLNHAQATNALYAFETGAYPRWVTVFDQLEVQVSNAPVALALALVSLQPDTNGLQMLAVLDISLPETPRLLNKIPISDTLLGGGMQHVTQRADGLLEVAGSRNIVLLDPYALANTNAAAGQLHPAIAGVIPAAGGVTRSLGATDFGVHAVADGGRGKVVQSPPPMYFVSFPQSPEVVNPEALRLKHTTNLIQLMDGVRMASALAPARFLPRTNLNLPSDLEPIGNPALHFHVLMVAPGGDVGGHQTVELGLESLNPAGLPLSNPGIGFAPVRALSDKAQDDIDQVPRPDCGAPIRTLTAYRMSDDPRSPYYNYYLSRPFALVTEAIGGNDLDRLKTKGAVNREIIFSGYALRAFIDPTENVDSIVGPFAAQADLNRKQIFPIATVSVYTVNRDYLLGDNPPPNGGATPMEDSFGTIQAHSGELRTSDIDMSLPSPRMPINIIRSIGNQDSYEGPFGVGWDFNYNQRLTVLDPLTFPQGLQMPLVERGTKADSVIAGSQDVLFNSGEGQVYHFLWKGTNMPPEYDQDPLVKEFDYKTLVSDYYLPQYGLFNLLVKFKDGRFERLTPGGTRYRYTSGGRLETILDRYPQNRHDLQYDSKGRLVRIDDRSVTAPRYLLFGYYRRQNTDSDFTAGLDMDTANSFVEGKICRLMDYAGRDILFQYSGNGFLTNRLGIAVNGENGGFAGRNQTSYAYDPCRLVKISATAQGTPIIAAVNVTNANGKVVATASTGSKGENQYTIPVNNSAATMADQTSGVKLGDGSSAEHKFDKMGNVASTTVTGASGAPAMEVSSNTVDGLVAYVKNPEGDAQTMTYDSSNPVFRSRGNLLSVAVAPGPRGGQGYTETSHYDARYNEPSGVQVDANGFSITYTLTTDGRAVATIDFGGVGTRTASYDAQGQLTRAVDENGVVHTVDYDASTGFIQSESRGDVKVTYQYDGSMASQLGKPASLSPALGTPTTFLYNDNLQPVVTVRGELVSKTAYDELGRPTYRLEQVGGGKQWTQTCNYDDRGFVTNTTTSGIEVHGAESSLTTFYKPDARLRVKTITHPNGTLQSFEYDARGNVTKMTTGDYTEEYAYDLNNNVTQVKQGGDVVRVLSYDGHDRLTNVLHKTGTSDYTEASSFYPGGQLESFTVTDPIFGVVREVTYDDLDALGRHLTVSTHGTAISPRYTYTYNPRSSGVSGPRHSSTTTWNTAGDETGYTDPNVKQVIQRDANGRPFQVDRQEDGGSYSLFFGYDDLDHQTSLGDLLGTKFTYIPRADGNYLQVINARAHATELAHSSLGELLRKRRADGMEVVYRHDTQRQLVYEGDPGAGFNYAYDASFRRTNTTLRSGAAISYTGFDPRSMPRVITTPGGDESLVYDLQRRLLQRKINYQSTRWEEDCVYDALGRVREVNYTQNGGVKNTAVFDFDRAGPLMQANYHEDGADFTVRYGYYADGIRREIQYPSGVTVQEIRDATGRLTGVSDADGNIISAVSWQGNGQPRVVQLGGTMQIINNYDARGRLTGSRATRQSDGAVLAHLRYQYDDANNLQIRQFVHRGYRADVFGFDGGERIAQAQVGMLVTNIPVAGPGLYQRQYDYHAGGLDYLTAVRESGPWAGAAPVFATNWTAHDAFLLPAMVDGFARGAADPQGNVATTRLWVRPTNASAPQAVTATLQHDGRNSLFRVARADGVIVENQYQPGGLRFSRTVSQGGAATEDSAFVYDADGRLLEEYDRIGAQPVLIARYYYGSGDSPVAGDLRDTGSGQLRRYYFLRDNAMSVIAVADADGNVLERVWYDTFGQPFLQRRDLAAPVVQRIVAENTNTYLIAVSEPVQPAWADPGPGSGILALTNDLQQAFVFEGGITGVVTLVASPLSAVPYSVLRFTPSQVVTGTLTLTLRAGVLADEWANTNAAQTLSLTNLGSPAGTVYYAAPAPADTSPDRLARSDVGSPFLFQGQYFDYDTGLIYLRARFYDPYSGMFFERDPVGYEGSVNHYAGFANNPVSFRDPSGLRPQGMKMKDIAMHLRYNGFSSKEIKLFRSVHPKLTKLGLSDLEIAAHVRVMYKQFQKNGTRWEIGIRTFNNPSERLARMHEGHQVKPERVYDKSGDDALVRTEGGEVFTSDVDGLYAKRNGQIASLKHVQEFQMAVNKEVERLTEGWHEQTSRRGQTVIENRPVQEVYCHGISLNIPQEYGARYSLGERKLFGYQAFENINVKMKKGIGEAFSFKMDDPRNGFEVTERVNVRAALEEHESYYKNVLLNPLAIGRGFSPGLWFQRWTQSRRDKAMQETLFPKPFWKDLSEGVN